MTWSRAALRPRGLGAVLLTVLALTGCGSSAAGGPSTSAPGGSGSGGGATSLTITVKASDDAAPESWTLTCDPAGGTHPDPTAACTALAAAEHPFAPVARDVACTEIYGGPQTATVTGTYEGQAVNASFNRTNGCEINRWEVIAPVLVLQGGAD